jgi:hypothetical protein
MNSSSGLELAAFSWMLMPAFSLRMRLSNVSRTLPLPCAGPGLLPAVADEEATRDERLDALPEAVGEDVQRIKTRVAISADFLQSDGGFGETNLCNP